MSVLGNAERRNLAISIVPVILIPVMVSFWLFSLTDNDIVKGISVIISAFIGLGSGVMFLRIYGIEIDLSIKGAGVEAGISAVAKLENKKNMAVKNVISQSDLHIETDYTNFKLAEPKKNVKETADLIQRINQEQLTLGGLPEFFEDDDTLMRQAVVLFNAEDYESAKAYYKKILKRDPENIRVLKNLGQSYTALGMFKKAEECYDKILTLAPRDSQSKVLKGLQIFLNNIENKPSILDTVDELYNKALVDNPKNGLAQYFLAANQCWRGDFENALQYLSTAFENDPKLKELFKKFDSKKNGPFEKFITDENVRRLIQQNEKLKDIL